jgi:hypothetical protein
MLKLAQQYAEADEAICGSRRSDIRKLTQQFAEAGAATSGS